MDSPHALTESRHPDSAELDRLSSLEIVSLMNREDGGVVRTVQDALPFLAQAVDALVERMRQGGRLFYVGAGTSGRLGALDAAECPPTFGTDPELVQCVMAGGSQAFHRAVEHAEDDPAAGAAELDRLGLSAQDFVVGISASGRTPFVIGALRRAREVGAGTGSIFCNPGAPMATEADHPILLAVGPEILTGSTRLKAGTATKMALNMLSTAAMVRLGRSFGNLMVDVKANSAKLRERRVRILADTAGLPAEEAARLLERAGGELRVAILMAASGVDADEARRRLADAADLREILEDSQN